MQRQDSHCFGIVHVAQYLMDIDSRRSHAVLGLAGIGLRHVENPSLEINIDRTKDAVV
jgi:hypothetical protein